MQDASGSGSSLSQLPNTDTLTGRCQWCPSSSHYLKWYSPKCMHFLQTSSHRPLIWDQVPHPIPRKLAEQIWKGEYVKLRELLPSQFGAPQLTHCFWLIGKIGEAGPRQKKEITSIQNWIIAFSALIFSNNCTAAARASSVSHHISTRIHTWGRNPSNEHWRDIIPVPNGSLLKPCSPREVEGWLRLYCGSSDRNRKGCFWPIINYVNLSSSTHTKCYSQLLITFYSLPYISKLVQSVSTVLL